MTKFQVGERVSRRFWYFAIGGLLLGGLIIGLPYLLEAVVSAELADRLEERDAQVDWRRLEWRWPASVALEGIEFSAADGRVSGEADHLEVALVWRSLLSGPKRIDAVEIDGATVVVDVHAGGEGSGDGAQTDESQTGGDMAARWAKLARVGSVSGRDVDVELRRGGAPLAKTRVDDFEITKPDSDKRAGGERSLSATGTTTLSHPRLAALGLDALPWRAGGHSSMRAPIVELVIDAPTEGAPLVDLAAGELGSVRADGLSIKAKALRLDAIEVGVRGLGVHLGAGGTPAVHLDAEEAAVSNLSARMLTGATSSAEKLAALLGQVDATVAGGSFSLAGVRLVEELAAVLDSGKVWARGESSGGEFGLNAHFDPGRLLPRAMTLYASNVVLEKLPGLKQGRTLPQRGVRGRIGGTVDLDLVLLTDDEPPVGSHAGAARLINSGLTLAGAAEWTDGHVDLSGLADAPLTGIDAGVEFGLEWAPERSELRLFDARASYGPIDVDLQASMVDWPFDPIFDLEARVEEIACQEAVRAFPPAMLGPYANIQIDGEAAPTLRFHLPWERPNKLRLSVDDFAGKCEPTALVAAKEAWPTVRFATAETKDPPAEQPPPEPAEETPEPGLLDSVLGQQAPEDPEPAWPVPEKLRDLSYELPEPPEDRSPSTLDDVFWLNRPFIKQVEEGVSDDAEVLVGPGTDAYVPLDELPPFVGGASYLSEEMGFYENHGVQLGLIQKALRMDLEEERFVYGGSTVTQQLVKNLFLTRDKTLARKLKEALIAWRIEHAVPKWRVLELYLNCIEYAQDVYGIGPAAEYYFGKDARDLSPKEAVFLAILKPAPWYGDRFRKKGTTPTKHWWFNRIGEIMERLVEKGYLTEEQAEAEKPYVLQWDEEGRYTEMD
ncbi:MAG: transglycosylase domain-containing protein [Persicimonas sp.]